MSASRARLSGVAPPHLALRDLGDARRYVRCIMEVSLDVMVSIGPRGRIADANEAAVRATGVARARLVGSDFSGYFTHPEQARAAYQRARAQGRVLDYPLTIRHASGERTDVVCDARAYRDSHGRVAGVLALVRDVTGARRAERHIAMLVAANQALMRARDEDTLLRQLCEIITSTGRYRLSWIGVAVPEGRYVRPVAQAGVAHGYVEQTKITWDESTRGYGPTGRAVRQRTAQVSRDILNDPTMAPWREAAMACGYRSSAAVPFTVGADILVLHAYADRPDAFDEAELSTLRQLAGNLSVGIGALRSHLERERAQLELTAAHAQLRRLNADLEDRVRQRHSELLARTAELTATNEQLCVANSELESFCFTVSHDLRSPVRAVLGFAEILHEEYGRLLDDEGRRLLAGILGRANRMGDLIDDLLNLSRIGRRELATGPVDMAFLARSVAAELSTQEPERDIAIEVGDLAPAVGDPSLLTQVWTNLLSNALKFTAAREQARVRVRSVPEDGHVAYHVTDNGVGFDMADAANLFGVFRRLHAQDEYPGTGVGLAIVARIVARHGGRVWADAAPDRGATFSFALPGGASPGGAPANGALPGDAPAGAGQTAT